MHSTIKFVLLSTVSLISLSACSVMNSDFDCPIRSGVNCKSLDSVYHMLEKDRPSQGGSYNKRIVQKPIEQKHQLLTVIHAPIKNGEKNVRKATITKIAI